MLGTGPYLDRTMLGRSGPGLQPWLPHHPKYNLSVPLTVQYQPFPSDGESVNFAPAGFREGGEGLPSCWQQLGGWKGRNTALPIVWEFLGSAHLSTASKLCPFFAYSSKTVTNLLPLPKALVTGAVI